MSYGQNMGNTFPNKFTTFLHVNKYATTTYDQPQLLSSSINQNDQKKVPQQRTRLLKNVDQDGYAYFQRTDIKSQKLEKLKPILNITGDTKSVLVKINDIDINMCKEYLNWQMTYMTLRGEKPKCDHKDNDPIHQHLEICYFYAQNNCKNIKCTRYHADIIHVNQNEVIKKQNNHKKALCLMHLLHSYNQNIRPCQYGYRCNHSHTISDLNTSSLDQFDRDVINNTDKQKLQKIFDECSNVLNNNKDEIIQLYVTNNKERPNIPPSIPSYFIEYLEILSYSLYLASKNNIDIYNKLNIQNINWVQGLLRRMKQCPKDINFHFKQVLKQPIKKEEVCIHYNDCNSGFHISLNDQLKPLNNKISTMICMHDLIGNNCSCHSQNAEEMKTALSKQIADLAAREVILLEKQLLNNSQEVETNLKMIKKAKEDKIWKLLNTNNKLHLIRDLGYTPLKQANLEIYKDDKEFNDADYKEIDTKTMSEDQFYEYINKKQQRDNSLNQISKKHAQDIKDKKERKYKEDIERYNKACELYNSKKDSDTLVKEWFELDAWKYIENTHYLVDRETYTNWIKMPLGCDFSKFKQHVLVQSEKWDNMDDINKEKYYNIWSYIYNKPIEEDSNIVGDMAYIIDSNPEIWYEYLDKYAITNYSTKFHEYILKNEQFVKAHEINKKHPEYGFNKALNYVKYNIYSTKISYEEYCNYDNHTIIMWREINDLCTKYNTKQYTITEFIDNKTNLIEYYKYGIKHYGVSKDSFTSFLKDKADGWKFNISPIKLNYYSSLLSLSIEQLKEFFQKNNIWSIHMMRNFKAYIPPIIYTINSKAHMYTIFTSIVDNQIKSLYKIIITPEINKILNNNGEFNKRNTDLIAEIKILVNEINNATQIMHDLSNEFKDRASEMRLLKSTFDPNSELLVLASKVLDIFKNIKGKRGFDNLKIKTNIQDEDNSELEDLNRNKNIKGNNLKKKDTDTDSDTDSDSDSDSDSDTDSDSDSDSDNDTITIKSKDLKPKELYELMNLGYDCKIYIMNEHPNALPIDKTSSGRKIFFGPFPDKDKGLLEELIIALQESKFGKGSNLGVKILTLEDPTNNKLPSLHIVINDKKITSKSNKYKEKTARQDKTEDEYGYDWVADLFINIINKKFNYSMTQVLTNIFTLEARMQDHINRNNRAGIAKVVKKIIIKEKVKTKLVLTKEEKTQMIKDKLTAKAAERK